MEKEKIIEVILLLIVFSVLLYEGPGTILDQKIKHDFPYGYYSSDAFQHQVRVEDIKQMGNYRYEAYYSVGGEKDVVGFYPPLFHHLAVLFSYVSGLESYDAAYLLSFLLAFLAIFVTYIGIRHFNRDVALLSLPFALLLFSKIPYQAFAMGRWPAITAMLFVVSFLVLFYYINERWWPYAAGILLAGIFLSHFSELILIILPFALLLILLFVRKKFPEKIIKGLLICGMVALLLIAFYLPVATTWIEGSGEISFEMEDIESEGPVLKLLDFSWLLIFLFLGVIVSIWQLKSKENPIIVSLLVIFPLSFLTIRGLTHWIIPLRSLWPIFLMFFFGLGIYTVLKFMNKADKIIVFGVSIVLIALLHFTFFQPIINQGLMSKPNWDAMLWVRENTPKDSQVYFFFDHLYTQNAMLRNSWRTHYLPTRNSASEQISTAKIKRNLQLKLMGDNGIGFPYRKGLFEFGYHWEEKGGQDYYYGIWDICNIDYYIIDTVSQDSIISKFNSVARAKLIEAGFKEEYFNGAVSILKNPKKGGDCLNGEEIDLRA